ncbi:PepSY domain-containing protein [Thermomonas carbonis]|uniref:PepSY domain-containing protein n=1 Tax=Thermomonas carbonis TaxID=1463158 RepID=A0A7G9STZ8_9GAMM|nr:hypothetical protein [Thermomonas carbonis]QNN71323.1 hypothetical protein H9L16_07155 [Thermomonas carbonis]
MTRVPKSLSNLLCVAVLAGLPPASAWAQQSPPPPQRDRGDARNNDDNRRGSLSDAVRRVERDTRGEVLSAERVQYDGRDMHRVKVVDDQGRVRVFMQDPQRRDSGSTPSPRSGGNTGGGNNDRGQAPRRPPARDDDD